MDALLLITRGQEVDLSIIKLVSFFQYQQEHIFTPTTNTGTCCLFIRNKGFVGAQRITLYDHRGLYELNTRYFKIFSSKIGALIFWIFEATILYTLVSMNGYSISIHI